MQVQPARGCAHGARLVQPVRRRRARCALRQGGTQEDSHRHGPSHRQLDATRPHFLFSSRILNKNSFKAAISGSETVSIANVPIAFQNLGFLAPNSTSIASHLVS